MSESEVRAAQRAIEVLSAYGVSHIFGVPGAKIDTIYDALVDGGPQLVVYRTPPSWPRRSVGSPASPVPSW
jgi:acetolactate synthase-1/2/3 large subunit